jgi:hypothetical protein
VATVNARSLFRLAILLAAWLMATGAVGTCAFFKPTEPESPNRPPITPDYSSPIRTLETLAKGIEDKNQSNGQDVYMGALADSSQVGTGDGRAFHALFDARDLLEHPWAYDWTRDYEPVLLQNLYEQATYPFEMTWEPYEPGGNETEDADEALLHRKYTLVQLVNTQRDTIAIGAADLYFVRSQRNADWVIAVWQDIRIDPRHLTFGKRRLETQHL